MPHLAVILLALLGAVACGGGGREPALERRLKTFSALMNELGPLGADLKPFIEASDKSRRLAREGKRAESAAVLDEAIRRMEAMRPGAAPAEPLSEDWTWSADLSATEQAEPLASDLALVVSDAEYPHIPGFLNGMSKSGVNVRRIKADDFAALRKARIVAVLGGPGSADGVGGLVRKLLSSGELKSLAQGSRQFLLSNVFRPRQSVVVFSALWPEQMGRLAVERDMDVYQRVAPPLTKRGNPRYSLLHSAVSKDGVHWSEEDGPPIPGISVPEIVRLDKGWRLYFIDGQSGGPGAAFSQDGRAWRFERLRTKDIPYAEGMGVADPNIVRLEDGRWRMYFDAGARPGQAPNEGLLSAVSGDGLSFTMEEGLRFAEGGMADPEVHRMGALWRLFYPTREAGRIATAVSRDGGRSFEREATLDVRSTGSFDVVATEGGWRMYANAERGMLIFRSTDGLRWSREGEVPFEARNAAVARLPGGGWRMYYNK